MELFRETLDKMLQTKRAELMVFKKTPVVTVSDTSDAPGDASQGTSAPVDHPPLDYSVSKMVKTLREFEAERLKKSKRAIAEKALKASEL